MKNNIDVKGYTDFANLPFGLQYISAFFLVFGLAFCGSVFFSYLIFKEELSGFNQVYANLLIAFVIVTPYFVNKMIQRKKTKNYESKVKVVNIPLGIQYVLAFFLIFGVAFCSYIFFSYLVFGERLNGFSQIYINLLITFVIITSYFINKMIKNKKEA
ncbi:hypothetical protein [Ornithobacterium rhinotracheale]|uniref:Uncharacterized protein n=1 Tax=Ornithobacterium rhinotracheale (strain ATCC 51463 / DSM 15997 / CCUG 23171 / CIP 104009 / LMG 9086) TaxID=867902 RepID=I3ZYR2_ORNRL|nr:hypothetical protein [Ornithobacterium rhinotracheale]AFL96846.1 hypothetical protein Ornrh_0646 [Ornithobacterium rhinotracheale DSM 15997]AIQ00540.1 hypothetical protein Q785_06500 [Ornithobacterium rhinotracheale ORT-UMN 88]KGB66648.1 hypothetical protein Q787_06315 [Ornithobacterium rhinotracheale H06-030791]MBN3663073.1 hypothetical protein [Ornithobacterium rhinotracheale]MCK0194923.1 hypothetical protein [Ornithobacterium rhinotracheale]